MDVLLRLRVLIWVLVISLWGVMVYQYLGEDENNIEPMRQIVNPFPEGGGGTQDSSVPNSTPASAAVNASTSTIQNFSVPQSLANSSDLPAAPYFNEPLPPKQTAHPVRTSTRRRTAHRSWREDRTSVLPDPPVPPGFQKSVTRHFNVYAEKFAASDRFLELIENLHANLMLDLAPFSPWAGHERVSIFLFKSQDTYRQVTSRPLWSGGASSVPKRKIYVYESEELPGILAHELTHIYFDGFFLRKTSDPLWLSEGMATLLQVERGLSAPNWLRENLMTLDQGGGLPFQSFMSVTTTSGWSDEAVRLWYAQAYSVVRYLIRTQYRSSFYKFAAYLRDGRPVPEALYRAYGAPYTRVRALEIAWRHEISRGTAGRFTTTE